MPVPEHLRRFPTAASIRSLAARLGLPDSPGMQDWPWEVADAGRLDKLLAVYEQGDLTEDERFTLMEIMLQSCEDLGPGLGADPRWHRVLDLLDANIELHAWSVWYWSDVENEREEDRWSVAPFLRRLLARHRSHFQR